MLLLSHAPTGLLSTRDPFLKDGQGRSWSRCVGGARCAAKTRPTTLEMRPDDSVGACSTHPGAILVALAAVVMLAGRRTSFSRWRKSR